MTARHYRPGMLSASDYTFIAIIALILAILLWSWMLWDAQHETISALVMRIFHGEMELARLFTDRFDRADAQMRAADPASVTIDQLVRLGREIGRFYLVPALLVVGALAIACFRGAASARFRRSLDLDGLMQDQLGFFRGPSAFAGRRLGLVAPAPGDPRPADPALSVVEWVGRFAAGGEGSFDVGLAREELARQLGPIWEGVSETSPAVRCMLAAFALHGAGRRAEASDFLGDLSASLRGLGGRGTAGPDQPLSFAAGLVAQADEIVRNPALMKDLGPAMGRHAFTVPALMSALIEARNSGGVLAPAEFAFLKLVDRRLWYALHSLGYGLDGEEGHRHPNPRVEAAGAREHWEAEMIAGEPIYIPELERSVAVISAATKTDFGLVCPTVADRPSRGLFESVQKDRRYRAE